MQFRNTCLKFFAKSSKGFRSEYEKMKRFNVFKKLFFLQNDPLDTQIAFMTIVPKVFPSKFANFSAVKL